MTKKQRRLARQAAEAEAQKQAQEQVQAQVEEVEATVVEETPTPTTPIELDPEIQALEQALTAGIESLTPKAEPVAEVPVSEIQETVKTVTDEQIKEMSDIYVDTSAEQIKTLQAKVNMLINRINNMDEAYRSLQKERDDAVDKLTAEKAKSNDLNAKAVTLVAEKNKLKELCNSYALQAKHAKEVAAESQNQMQAIQNQLLAQKEANAASYNKGYEECRAKAQCAYTALEKKLKEQVEANNSMKEYYSNRLTEYLKAMKASGLVG